MVLEVQRMFQQITHMGVDYTKFIDPFERCGSWRVSVIDAKCKVPQTGDAMSEVCLIFEFIEPASAKTQEMAPLLKRSGTIKYGLQLDGLDLSARRNSINMNHMFQIIVNQIKQEIERNQEKEALRRPVFAQFLCTQVLKCGKKSIAYSRS